MKDFLCLLLTSNGCGHCSVTRGDGIINNGKTYMKPEVMRELVGDNNINLFNIHYENMSGRLEFISDVSKFTINKNNILQERYFKFEDNAKVRVIKASPKNKELQLDYVKKDGEKINWKNFIESKIPSQLSNYTYYFPCFMILRKSDWLAAIDNDKLSLVALTNAGHTIIDKDGIAKLNKDPASFNSRMLTGTQLISNVITGKEKILPSEIRNSEKPTEKPSEKPSEKPLLVNFIIKPYED